MARHVVTVLVIVPIPWLIGGINGRFPENSGVEFSGKRMNDAVNISVLIFVVCTFCIAHRNGGIGRLMLMVLTTFLIAEMVYFYFKYCIAQ